MEPVKDPTRPRFWRTRNLLLLAVTGALPLVGHTLWKWGAERMESFWSYDKRLRELEVNAASDQAVWGALRDLTAKYVEMGQQLTLMQKLFDREWGRGAGVAEKEYAEKIGLLNSQIRTVREVHRQLSILIGEHKVKNPASKCEVPPLLPAELLELLEPLPTEGKRYLELQIPASAPASAPLDPDALKRKYERDFPALQVPNQQQRK